MAAPTDLTKQFSPWSPSSASQHTTDTIGTNSNQPHGLSPLLTTEGSGDSLCGSSACNDGKIKEKDVHWWRAWRSRPCRGEIDTTWRETWRRWTPLLGLGSLLWVLLSIPAAAIVLSAADGSSTSAWKIAPNVWLIIFTGIGNKALAFAALQGAIITWWLRAVDGSTLERLHRDWSHGPGAEIWTILTSGRRCGVLGLATLATAAMLIDGILLQKAVSVIQLAADANVLLNVKIAPEIPTNYTGIIYVRPGQYQPWQAPPAAFLAFQNGYDKVHDSFMKGRPIEVPEPGCDGTCVATVRAPAMVPFECQNTFTDYMNFTAVSGDAVRRWPSACNRDYGNAGYNTTGWCPLLWTTTAPTLDEEYEGINLYSGTIDNTFSKTREAGNFTMRVCKLRPAIGAYSISIEKNGTLSADFGTPKFVAWSNNTQGYRTLPPDSSGKPYWSTLIGIVRSTVILFYSRIDAQWSTSYESTGLFSITAPTPFAESLITNIADYYSNETGYPIFTDPVPIMVKAINELMFRTALHASDAANYNELFNDTTLPYLLSEGASISSQLEGRRVDLVPKYRTVWAWFWGATSMQIFCTTLVAYLYWGYWRLGRSMSFSPLEIAKAFDAPMLSEIPTNMEASDMAKQLGPRQIRYGAVRLNRGANEDDSAARRLIFDTPDKVYKPMGHFSFGP